MLSNQQHQSAEEICKIPYRILVIVHFSHPIFSNYSMLGWVDRRSEHMGLLEQDFFTGTYGS